MWYIREPTITTRYSNPANKKTAASPEGDAVFAAGEIMRDGMRKKLHIAAWVLFVIYAAVMIYLLIFERLTGGGYVFWQSADYARDISGKFQLVPFRTIIMFAKQFHSFSLNDPAFYNIGGNIVLFIPIGIFLPFLFRRQRKFPVFLLTTVITICVIELIQALTLLGTCDIDDLILNTFGAGIGFLIYKLAFGRNKKDESSDPS